MEGISILGAIDRFFKITKSGSTIRTEVFSGITAYLTVVYIFFLIPATIMNIYPHAFDASGEIIADAIVQPGITANQMLVSLTVACCIAAALGTIIMAFATNLPFVQGPSLAISTFISYTICQSMGYSYNEALAIVFISGITFLLISIMGWVKLIQDSIPTNIKFSVTAGIGLFVAFMGMQKAHIVEGNSTNLVQLVSFSDLSSYNAKSAILCLIGIIIIAVMLFKHIHGAILFGKIICIILAIPMGLIHHSSINYAEYKITLEPIVFKMDFAGLFSDHIGFGIAGIVASVIVMVASLCIMDVFQTLGTIIATDYIITLSHEGSVSEKLPKILKTDAISTTIGALVGVPNVSTNVESTAMVIEGGRTGFSAIISAGLFVLTIFTAPYASIVPSAATATTLIMSGILMMNVIKYINFDDIEEALPAFLTMAMMPLTYSLVAGIFLGLTSSVMIKIFSGKAKEIGIGTYVLVLIFIILAMFTTNFFSSVNLSF